MKLVPITTFKMIPDQRIVLFTGQGQLDIEPVAIAVPFGVLMLSAAQVIGNVGADEMAKMGATATQTTTPQGRTS